MSTRIVPLLFILLSTPAFAADGIFKLDAAGKPIEVVPADPADPAVELAAPAASKEVVAALAPVQKADAQADADLKAAQLKALTKKVEGRKASIKLVESAIRSAAIKGDDQLLEQLMGTKKDLQAQIVALEAVEKGEVSPVKPADEPFGQLAPNAQLGVEFLTGKWTMKNLRTGDTHNLEFHAGGRMRFVNWYNPTVERVAGKRFIFSPMGPARTVIVLTADKNGRLLVQQDGNITGEVMIRQK